MATPHPQKSLFEVLNLLPNPLNLGFSLQNGLSCGDFGGFAPDRVDFPEQLLDEKVEFSATFLDLQLIGKLQDMAFESDDLLGDVAAIGEERELLQDTLIGRIET
jgi:hypothetical protein